MESITDLIYFDNAATTWPKPEAVYLAVDRANRNLAFNSGRGIYDEASKASREIDEARQSMASFAGLNYRDCTIFTASATVALNMVLFGTKWDVGDNVYFSPFEHNSVLRPLFCLQERYALNLIELPLTNQWEVNLQGLKNAFEQRPPKMVVCTHASNVCGKIMPVCEITRLAHEYESKVLIDGAQTLGIIDVNLQEIGCDYYVFAGHKGLYGPFGIGGILFRNPHIDLAPFIYGGTGYNSEEMSMPSEGTQRFEAGSMNVVAISGLNAGIRWIQEQKPLITYEKELVKEFLLVVSEFPEIKIVGPNDPNSIVPVISCNFSGYSPVQAATLLSERFHIAVRSGLHCAPSSHRQMGTFPQGAVRFSFNAFNTLEQVHSLSEVFWEM